MYVSQDDSHVRGNEGCDRGESRCRILFPADFGSASRGAWPYALGLARALAADLVILHVVALTAADYENPAGMVGVDMVAEALRRDRETALEQLRAEAVSVGVSARTVTVVGHVRREIVRAAVRERAAVIVVGLRRHPIGRNLLGAYSIAGWVASHAPCSVWIVSSGPAPTCALPWRAAMFRGHDETLQGSAGGKRDLHACAGLTGTR